MFLLDTNVILEVCKAHGCNAGVARWFADVTDADRFVSVVVTGEIRQGIERLRRRDSRQAEILERWLEDVVTSYADRVLPIDGRDADAWLANSTTGSTPTDSRSRPLPRRSDQRCASRRSCRAPERSLRSARPGC